jgi:molybdate transport system permease protein
VYDHVESLEYAHAHWLSGGLLLLSFVLLVTVYALNRRLRLLRVSIEARFRFALGDSGST